MRTAAIAMLVSAFVLTGCAGGSKQSLKDINPNRTYPAPFAKVMEAIKVYGAKETFRIDRFDNEFGTVVGYRNYTTSMYQGEMGSESNRKTIVMRLTVTPVSDIQTSLNITFRLADDQRTMTREDEGDLLDCYHTFFSFMEETFPTK
jgi:hypothetical protein